MVLVEISIGSSVEERKWTGLAPVWSVGRCCLADWHDWGFNRMAARAGASVTKAPKPHSHGTNSQVTSP